MEYLILAIPPIVIYYVHSESNKKFWADRT